MSNNTELIAADQLLSRINTLHSAVSEALSTALTNAMEAGGLLIELKSKCPHGTFISILAESFEGSQKSASLYMRLYTHREAILANRVTNLTLTEATKLLPKGKPRGKPKQAQPAPLSLSTDVQLERVAQFVAALTPEQESELRFQISRKNYLSVLDSDPSFAEMIRRNGEEIWPGREW